MKKLICIALLLTLLLITAVSCDENDLEIIPGGTDKTEADFSPEELADPNHHPKHAHLVSYTPFVGEFIDRAKAEAEAYRNGISVDWSPIAVCPYCGVDIYKYVQDFVGEKYPELAKELKKLQDESKEYFDEVQKAYEENKELIDSLEGRTYGEIVDILKDKGIVVSSSDKGAVAQWELSSGEYLLIYLVKPEVGADGSIDSWESSYIQISKEPYGFDS